ncbi:hypothetical protein COX85_02290 [Candidatus Micrarchaeota archaeon CG_4_10_14_0_2_um_filter_55_9]|nr:MAG: hypothetical protein AUJ15_03385 [Candidatus Micrarchaeota archaeon CG1_02_55_41]PIO02802.1 MAG: hypothetical protein COT57_02205 [Candidatus Micrarchaeota archaeon CG09_land_8_20_14_0_10_55_25]PIZ91733.1 MAG: hypothetical protein COX85_02290 [Candidatus Micrarchaeota archaeon CG_4_10_14_0_2_um_filter_55_9]PJD01423.1 MAG: hypothetical protein COU38_01015 [Candidatus Micrarchaeota archaeon CG10_big_fil_rev_8_21_14_0_10_54_18]
MKRFAIALFLAVFLFGCVQQAPSEAAPTPTTQVTPTIDALDAGELGDLDEIGGEELSELEDELSKWLGEEGFNVSDDELDLLS